MPRKKKKDQTQEVMANPVEAQGVAQTEEQPVSDPAPVEAPAAPKNPPQQIDLQDAARRWVIGYKEHWWPSIRKHATSLGFGLVGTEEECRRVLTHWGARLL